MIRSPASLNGPRRRTGRVMPTFDQYDVISVPFPYTDRATFERRPALVVSNPAYQDRVELLRVVINTAAHNRGWKGDVVIADHRAARLSIPSIIRPDKVATVEAARAKFRGKVSTGTAAAVAAAVTAAI